MPKPTSGAYLLSLRAPVRAVGLFGLSLAGVLAGAGNAQAQSLPQLDFTKYPPQLIWLAIAFIALYLLMSRGALPKIGSVLEERREKIESNLNRADALKTEAQVAEQAYETALTQARAEATAAVKGVRDAAAAEAASRQAELSERLNASIREAETNIANAKQKAIAEIRDTAADAVRAATKKLAGESLDDDAVTAAVAKAMEGSRR